MLYFILLQVISIASLEEEEDAEAAARLAEAEAKPSVWRTIVKAIRQSGSGGAGDEVKIVKWLYFD